MSDFVSGSEHITIKSEPDGSIEVQLLDPALGPDAPPGVEFQCTADLLNEFSKSMQDHLLNTFGLERRQVRVSELQEGDIFPDMGDTVTAVVYDREVISVSTPACVFFQAGGWLNTRINREVTVHRRIQ